MNEWMNKWVQIFHIFADCFCTRLIHWILIQIISISISLHIHKLPCLMYSFCAPSSGNCHFPRTLLKPMEKHHFCHRVNSPRCPSGSPWPPSRSHSRERGSQEAPKRHPRAAEQRPGALKGPPMGPRRTPRRCQGTLSRRQGTARDAQGTRRDPKKASRGATSRLRAAEKAPTGREWKHVRKQQWLLCFLKK